MNQIVTSDDAQTWTDLDNPVLDDEELMAFVDMLMRLAIPCNMHHDDNPVWVMGTGSDTKRFISFEKTK